MAGDHSLPACALVTVLLEMSHIKDTGEKKQRLKANSVISEFFHSYIVSVMTFMCSKCCPVSGSRRPSVRVSAFCDSHWTEALKNTTNIYNVFSSGRKNEKCLPCILRLRKFASDRANIIWSTISSQFHQSFQGLSMKNIAPSRKN